MLKIKYESDPFYSGIGLDEPCKKDLDIEFDDEATSVEVMAEMLRVLYYAGYSRFDVEKFDNMRDEFLSNGVIDE